MEYLYSAPMLKLDQMTQIKNAFVKLEVITSYSFTYWCNTKPISTIIPCIRMVVSGSLWYFSKVDDEYNPILSTSLSSEDSEEVWTITRSAALSFWAYPLSILWYHFKFTLNLLFHLKLKFCWPVDCIGNSNWQVCLWMSHDSFYYNWIFMYYGIHSQPCLCRCYHKIVAKQLGSTMLALLMLVAVCPF